jgi:hypothetical protein
MTRGAAVAVLLCLLYAGGCGSDDGSQPAERPAPARPAGETVQSYLPVTPVPVTPGGHPAYRPTTIDRGMASPIERIRWKAYGDSTAVGTGIADGKRVTIRLRALDVCNHKLTYMEWAIDRVGSRKKPEFSTILGTHASLDVCDPELEE